MTGFAVAWGIFMLTVLLGASSGIEHGMHEMVDGNIRNTVTIWPGWTSMPYKGLPQDRPVIFEERDFLRIRSLSFVDHFTPIVQSNLNVNIGDKYTTADVNGVAPVYMDVFGIEICKGRFLNALDEDKKRKVCVIDEKVVDELGGADLMNKFLQIGNTNCLVVGIAGTNEGFFSRSATIYMPYNTYQALFASQRQYAHVAFSVDDSYYDHHTPDNLEQSLRHLLGPSMKFDEKDDRALFIQNEKNSNEEITRAINVIRIFVLIVGWLMLVSGVVGVSNIMLVSVRERTKEFGIRKAIGAPPYTILTTVMGESLIITLLFGMIGVWLGAVVIALVDLLVPASQFFRHPTVDVTMVIIAFVTLTIAGTLAGLTPAIRAVRIKPIEALNYEK
jgi:putative ABC transport system permease protein